MRYILLALGLLAADQFSKWFVISRMTKSESIPVIEPVFYITYVMNPGAAFGMLPYKTVFFVSVTVVVLLGIIFFARRIPARKVLLKTGLALQVGGAVGNLIDRLRFGQVVDFFDFRVWPVFNIADMGIVFGVGILFIELMKDDWRKQKQEPI
ncbi:signal peptidase II [Phosphitispora fastidiosa]|uniref:signal peptidase II n=1 Tax=Phosphitispora fastidiosa TaxID=2837202 RepID=UPI001E5FD73C|nr:signal peptidase II [Phosphitispora fastidiosa]MBU7008475.1 signal peptidase II [Phosphitispora fastidiosa]